MYLFNLSARSLVSTLNSVKALQIDSLSLLLLLSYSYLIGQEGKISNKV